MNMDLYFSIPLRALVNNIAEAIKLKDVSVAKIGKDIVVKGLI